MKTVKNLFIKMLVCIFTTTLFSGAFMVNTYAAAKVSSAVSWAVAIADDDNNGYSQKRRNQSNKLGGTEYDCSALVYAAYKYAGFSVTNGATSTMKNDFKKAGFTYISNIDFSSSSQLKKGDILWRNGHTEIYIGSNKRCGAHSDYDGKVGDSSGDEINVKTYSNNSWSGVFRYEKASSTSTTEKKETTSTTSSKTTTKTTSTDTTYNFANGTYVTTGNVNMRASANTTSEIILTLKEGTTFTVTSTSGRFGKTTHNGKTGYVSLLYASFKKAASTTSTTTSTYKTGYYLTTADVNFRKKASTESTVIDVINKNTKIYVTSVNGKWGKITFNGKTGYVSLKNAKVTTKYSTGTWKTLKTVYLRKSATSSSARLLTIKKNVKVKVKAVSGNWGKVTYSGKTGWVYLPSTNAK